MTKKEMFNLIATVNADSAEIVEFCNHEIEILSRKRGSVNSKAKAEADARAERVYNALAEMDKPVTVSELLALTSDEEVAGYTNQRVSALLRKLGERVVKTVDKKVSRFSVA